MSVLSIENLSYTYPGGQKPVLREVNCAFAPGKMYAITGPSGSGKSTLLHVLSSLENPTSGEVIYNAESLKKYNDNQLSILRRRRFGYVFPLFHYPQRN